MKRFVGEIEVPTLDGPVRLKVPQGSQHGQALRVRQRGMPRLRKSTQRGDLYARLNLSVPKKLSRQERELFEQLQRLNE